MKPAIFRFCFVCVWVLAVAHGLAAAEYFLDPVAGATGNPGTRNAPWGSLAEVAAAERVFAAGDVLTLLAGHHGSPVLRQKNPGEVKVRPAPGARVMVTTLTIQSGRFWTVEGLEISPETAPDREKAALLRVQGGSDNIVRGCLVYTVRDTTAWTKEDWNARARDGAHLSGTRQLLENSHIANVRFAVSVSAGAEHVTVRGNLIRNFSGDGIRGLGDYGVYEGNVVKNLYRVNDNHPDGFQSWSQTSEGVGRGIVKGVVVRGNYFLSYDDPNQPFRGGLQGIGCFDGFFEDWVVENNVVLTNAWHGIAFYGARNCRIVNNTVADISPSDKARPWIMITSHKNKQPSTGNLVRNNIACRINAGGGTGGADHNLAVPDSRRFFPDLARGDLRLARRSAAIDAGTSAQAPAYDARGAPREFPGNAAWDIGAFEFGAPEPEKAPSSFPPWEPPLAVPPMPDGPAGAAGGGG